MRRRLSCLAFLACVFLASGQTPSEEQIKKSHDSADQNWARKTGLSVAEVRAIRLFDGISDTTTNRGILNIDAKSLSGRNHILLVDLGTGCQRVRVVERTGDDFHEVWFFPGIPDPVWGLREKASGRENCADLKRGSNLTAHATADGRIVVEVRMSPDAFQRSIPADTYTFVWNGGQYVPESQAH